MSSSSVASLPSPSGAAESFSLTEPLCCVVQLKHQAPGVVHQVVLDPAKIKDGLIRIGEWPGDEAFGWQHMDNVAVLLVLGRASIVTDEKTGQQRTQVTPLND